MTQRKIVTWGDPILKEKALPVAEITNEIRTLLDDMLETMYKAPGIGLAATQVAQKMRLFVMDCQDGEGDPQPYKIINPELLHLSEEKSVYEEGCLSLPGASADVERPASVTLRYLDENGVSQNLDAQGLMATCIQHEIDHLDGVLFLDHLSPLKRKIQIKKIEKELKRLAEENV